MPSKPVSNYKGMEVIICKSENQPQKAAHGTEVTGVVFSISENTWMKCKAKFKKKIFTIK